MGPLGQWEQSSPVDNMYMRIFKIPHKYHLKVLKYMTVGWKLLVIKMLNIYKRIFVST